MHCADRRLLRPLAESRNDISVLKQKITTLSRDFLLYNLGTLGDRLAHRLNTFGAEHLMHNAALLHHNRFLQVGLEGAIGGALGE